MLRTGDVRPNIPTANGSLYHGSKLRVCSLGPYPVLKENYSVDATTVLSAWRGFRPMGLLISVRSLIRSIQGCDLRYLIVNLAFVSTVVCVDRPKVITAVPKCPD